MDLEEGLWFDAKQPPGYDFSSGKGRVELAKDASGLANSEGGYVVVGLRTCIEATRQVEVVSGLIPFGEAEFDIAKVSGIIKEYVFPQVVGMEVSFVENSETPGKGFGIIYVPPQDESKKYFLMKGVDEDGEALKQIVFGISQRKGSSTEPLDRARLHAMMQNGRSSQAQQLARIEEKINLIVRKESPSTAANSTIDINEMLRRISGA